MRFLLIILSVLIAAGCSVDVPEEPVINEGVIEFENLSLTVPYIQEYVSVTTVTFTLGNDQNVNVYSEDVALMNDEELQNYATLISLTYGHGGDGKLLNQLVRRLLPLRILDRELEDKS